MRHPFFGLLLTCVVFSANANRLAYPNFHLRRLPAAAKAKNASPTSLSGNTLTSNPSARTERTAFVLPRVRKTVSFPTKHEEESADWSAASQTSKTAEEQRPSAGVRHRSDGRSLRQNDGLDDEALASEALAVFESALLKPLLLVLASLPCCLSKRILEEHLNEARGRGVSAVLFSMSSRMTSKASSTARSQVTSSRSVRSEASGRLRASSYRGR